MAKQMTPAELRAAARKVHVSEPFYAESCLRLADVIEYAEPFAGKQFAGFAATWDAHPEMVEVVRIARGDTNERESSA